MLLTYVSTIILRVARERIKTVDTPRKLPKKLIKASEKSFKASKSQYSVVTINHHHTAMRCFTQCNFPNNFKLWVWVWVNGTVTHLVRFTIK